MFCCAACYAAQQALTARTTALSICIHEALSEARLLARRRERVADAYVNEKLQAPVVVKSAKDERGGPGGFPGPVFGSFLLVQKGIRSGERNALAQKPECATPFSGWEFLSQSRYKTRGKIKVLY